MATITPEIRFYLQSSLAIRTSNTYRSAWSSYSRFCVSCHVSSLPLDQTVLLHYSTSLARRLAYATIKVYLSGVQYYSNIQGYQIQISHMTQLYYLLRGVRRVQGNSRRRPRRPPITVPSLYRILSYIQSQEINIADKLLYRSVVTLAFFGMLRSAEYTCCSTHTYIPEDTLLVSDVTIGPNVQSAIIVIKASKTDPFKVGTRIRIAVTNSQLCPVTSLFNFINVHPNVHGPLFTFCNGTFLTRQLMSAFVQQALPNIVHVNTHSFRIGGATAAASAGISDSQIQILGRWSSDAYRRYLRLSDETVAQVMSRIASVSSFTRLWDSDLCASVAREG